MVNVIQLRRLRFYMGNGPSPPSILRCEPPGSTVILPDQTHSRIRLQCPVKEAHIRSRIVVDHDDFDFRMRLRQGAANRSERLLRPVERGMTAETSTRSIAASASPAA